MLYLTAYLKKSTLDDCYPKSGKPHHSNEALETWYLEDTTAVLQENYHNMEPSIRYEVPTVQAALDILSGLKSLRKFIYLNKSFNDSEAIQIAEFIPKAKTLVCFEYHCINSGGNGYSLRQPFNRLTDEGYDAITRAIELNPNIQQCSCFNNRISAQSRANRDQILSARNQNNSAEGIMITTPSYYNRRRANSL